MDILEILDFSCKIYYIISMDNEVEQMIYTAAVFKGTNVAEIARSIGMSPQNLYRKMKALTLKPEELTAIAKALGAEYAFFFTFPNGSKIGKLDKIPATKRIRTQNKNNIIGIR